MKQKLQIFALLCMTCLASCQKRILFKENKARVTNALIVPIGFKWENSRNINFSVSVTDTRFGKARNRILIYDGDPNAGGHLLLNGYATNKAAYSGKIYLSNLVSTVYIVKTAVDNTSVTSIVQVGNSDVNIKTGI